MTIDLDADTRRPSLGKTDHKRQTCVSAMLLGQERVQKATSEGPGSQDNVAIIEQRGLLICARRRIRDRHKQMQTIILNKRQPNCNFSKSRNQFRQFGDWDLAVVLHRGPPR